MTVAELEALLAADECPQRTKLERVRAQLAAIRALPDDEYARAVRIIKKRIGSPKLAAELAAVIAELAHGRETKPIGASRPEPTPVPWVGTTDDIAEIEAAIAADPEVQGPYTVLGDYWTANGDIRGELIAIGAALAKNPTHKVMRTAWTKLYTEHRRKLWGELAANIERLVRDVDWYMGFVRAVTIHGNVRTRCADILDALLDDPGPGRFVQRLRVEDDLTDVARVLAKRPRPTIRTLMLKSWKPIGDVSAIWPAISHVRELRLEGSGATLGDLRAPQLERFAVDFGPVEDGEQNLEFLASLWRGDGVPSLRTLALTNCDRTDDVCEALVKSPIAQQLVEIDLREGTMTEAGATVLCAHRDRFPKVQRWNLDLNYLTDAACAQLAALASVSAEDQRVDDEGRRHAASYE